MPMLKLDQYSSLQLPEAFCSEISENQGQDNDDNNEDLPCRIICHFDGGEWFIYNRTPAYDALKNIISRVHNTDDSSDRRSSSSVIQNESGEFTVNIDENNSEVANNADDSFFRKLLPIQLELERSAIIIGSVSTPFVLVAEFSLASGVYKAVKSRSTLDYYKLVLDLEFREPKIHLRPNQDYVKAYRDTVVQHSEDDVKQKDYINMDKEAEIIDEYAKVSTILACPLLHMNYYADVAGKVPREAISIANTEEIDVGNGDFSPEWGIDLIFTNVQVDYGPWADRQRALLQNFFFPPLYRNSKPFKKLSPGQDRLHTLLKIYIQFNDTTTLRIPLREASKDWKFNQNEEDDENLSPGSNRQHGWLEFKTPDEQDKSNDSTVNMILPMVYTDKGYTNHLEIDLENVELQTSVNFSRILTTKKARIMCDLPTPLEWNKIRSWEFDIYLTDAKIFLLRDHITLFQDLVKDWTAGSSPDQLHFIPMEYRFKPHFTNFELYLYVNEQNIINDPIDIDDNAFIIIKGPHLNSNVLAPFRYYNQEVTKILFDVEVTKGSLLMSPQMSQTLGGFLADDSKEFGKINSFKLDGTYQYYSSVDPTHLESLTLEMKGKEVSLRLFGFVIRYFIILQQNYFGIFINFMTLKEFLDKHDPKQAKQLLNSSVDASKMQTPVDPFELYLTLVVEDGTLVLPENLYNCSQTSTMHFHELQLDLRNLDVYM
ncbi:15222_t:CDS:10, partial [Acaulospora morrowiae]